jgi:glutamate dehydrogenase/leucine dehydrogenase
MSQNELERLSRAYIRQVGRILGAEVDVPAPDVYTNPQIMAWMADEFAFLRGHNEFGVITGKPLPLGGSKGRTAATGRGVVVVMHEALQRMGYTTPPDVTIAIQGFGNVGSHAARGARDLGYCITGVSDESGGYFNPNGLDIDDLLSYVAESPRGLLEGYPNAERISNADLLTLDADVLIPCALENQITHANVESIRARLIVEGANGPTTPEADDVLFARGVPVIPDILANAGGVTVSYFEMVQNAYDYYWEEAVVYERLDAKMTAAFHTVYDTAQKYRVHNRMAAYIVAIDRVAEAIRLRGWV